MMKIPGGRYLSAGLLCGICIWVYGLSWASLAGSGAAVILTWLSLADLAVMEIPDRYILAFAVWAAASAFVVPEPSIRDRILGFFAVAAPLCLLCAVVKDAFGGGDIKLLAVSGFFLGWRGILLAFLIAAVTGAARGLILRGRPGGLRRIAFAPHIAAGVYLVYVWGYPVILWYTRLCRF